MSPTTSQPGGGLETLPAEIIQKVAKSLSCLEAIALSLTYRDAYAAVNDWLVFAEVIRLSVEERVKRTTEDEREVPWTIPEHAYALAASSVGRAEVYKRYAWANEMANEVPYVMHSETLRLGQWIPMLQLCHHPLAQKAELAISLRLSGGENDSSMEDGATIFSVAMWLLDHDDVTILTKTKAGGLYLVPLRRPLRLNRSARHISATAATNYGITYMALTALITLGRKAGLRMHIQPQPSFSPPRSLRNFPFGEYMDLPLPFAPTSDKEILTCHLSKMATKQFLEDGEWVGYRCLSFNDFPICTYPSVTKLKFQVGSSKRRGALRIFTRDASDDRGHFDLDGVLYASIGRMFMTKMYQHGNEPKWTMALALTPFGLVGSWSVIRRGHANERGGWLWLWKRSWGKDTP